METTSWKAMESFLEKNRGLILKICQRYRLNFTETAIFQEEAYHIACQTFNLRRTADFKHNFTNYFTQHLKTILKKEKTNDSIFEDVDERCGGGNGDNGDDPIDIACRKAPKEPAELPFEESEKKKDQEKAAIHIEQLLKELGRNKTERIIFLFINDKEEVEKEIEALPEHLRICAKTLYSIYRTYNIGGEGGDK